MSTFSERRTVSTVGFSSKKQQNVNLFLLTTLERKEVAKTHRAAKKCKLTVDPEAR